MPYPVLPPTPPPVVETLPPEGVLTPLSQGAIAPDSAPSATSAAGASLPNSIAAPERSAPEPSGPEPALTPLSAEPTVAPQLTPADPLSSPPLEPAEASPSLDSLSPSLQTATPLGNGLEASAPVGESVRKAVQQAAVSDSPSNAADSVVVHLTPSPALDGLKSFIAFNDQGLDASREPNLEIPAETGLFQPFQAEAWATAATRDVSHSPQAPATAEEGIPELAYVDPRDLDPSTLGLAPSPAIATLPPPLIPTPPAAPQTVDGDNADTTLLQPFGDHLERSITALEPMMNALESYVLDLQAREANGAGNERLSQLPESSPTPIPPLEPSPVPEFPPEPTLPADSLDGLEGEELPEFPTEPGQPSDSFPADSDFDLETIPEAVPEELLFERPTLEIPTPDFPQEELEIPDPTLDSDVDPADLDLDPQQPSPSPTGVGETVEVLADYQEFDQFRQVFIAEGNVEMRYQDSILRADRVVVSLVNRNAIASGNAALLANQQLLFGDRVQYDFVRQEGTIDRARGEIALSPLPPRDAPVLPPVTTSLSTDLIRLQPREVQPGTVLQEQQPLRVVPSGEGLTFGFGGDVGSVDLPGGNVRRLRFEADRVEFFPEGWEALNLRLTNDPFSPPELELRANSARLRRISPTQQELVARNPRLVFDRGLTIPLIRERYVFDERPRDAFFISAGFDEDDRGGFFLERAIQIVDRPEAFIQLTPQFYVQRAIDSENFLNESVFGIVGDAEFQLTPTTTLVATAELTSFDLDDIENNFRSNTRLAQEIGDHTLTLFHSYRERLFNGSLGRQNVRNSFGAVVTSPVYTLGDTGIRLTYQGGIQSINANINRDRRDELVGPRPRENNRATLTRYQIGARLRHSFFLWQGEPLPPTPTQGLRYTPEPVIPFLSFNSSLLGVASFYSSGDTQPILTTSVGLSGQIGHFSRPAFDYLGFNVSLSYTPDGPQSPFNFDREDDRLVLAGGATAQIIGPIRAGFQTSYNLQKEEEINTTYFLQYSRRTYSIDLRYSPTRETGSINVSINDFNWVGETTPFDQSDQ